MAFALSVALPRAPAACQVNPGAAGHDPSHAPWAEVHAGSELERYLRSLQLLGASDSYPWSLRGFSPPELERIAPADTADHPWRGRFHLTTTSVAEEGLGFAAPRAGATVNSGFPYGVNDGALWAGRGLTLSAEGGVAYRRGPLSASLQPVAFVAQNASFSLDGLRRAGNIDAPWRFGTDPYARLEPGESWVRVDWPWVTAGISTAGMTWGPADRFPLLLGRNAPGFPHAFLGTGTPLDIWIGELHGRLVWGRLEESDWAPASEFPGARFVSSAVVVFEPAWPSGLELGGGRLFHLPWNGGPGVSDIFRPFEAFTKRRIGFEVDPNTSENQLGAVFFRWLFPRGGLEVYGELFREDHAVDARDLIVEPDHDLATTLGVRKAWRREDGEIWTFQLELMDAKINHLDAVRNQEPPYVHSRIRQGHTHRGQILGSPAAWGGEGLSIGVDRYYPAGRWSLRWERTLRQDAPDGSGLEGGRARDVLHALTAEALLFRGPWELLADLTGVWNLNRDFGDDRGNLRLGVSARWRGW